MLNLIVIIMISIIHIVTTMLTMLAGGSQDEQLHNQRTLAKQRLQRDALSQEEQAHYPGTLCDAIENSADFRWSLINQHFIQLSTMALILQFLFFLLLWFPNPGEQSSFDNKARVLYAPAWHRQGPHQCQHHHHRHHHHQHHHHHHHHHHHQQQDYTAITAVVVVLGLFSFSCISLTLFRVYRFKVIFP